MKKHCILDENIKYICNYDYKYFLKKSNVVGVALGYKIKHGFRTCIKCITVFVNKKVPVTNLRVGDLIPIMYKGIYTDVVCIGNILVNSPYQSVNPELKKRTRPAIGGYSIGVDSLKPGSIGYLVQDDNEKKFILTCNHVVAGNDMSILRKRVVVQPAPKYKGKVPKDVVGVVYNMVRVSIYHNNNICDAAIVETDQSMAVPGIAFVGLLEGWDFAKIGEHVDKVGVGTGQTRGYVMNTNANIQVRFLDDLVMFRDQIITSRMSEPEDEGAILMNGQKKAIGMLMAQTQSSSIYNSIYDVLDSLNVKLVTPE